MPGDDSVFREQSDNALDNVLVLLRSSRRSSSGFQGGENAGASRAIEPSCCHGLGRVEEGLAGLMALPIGSDILHVIMAPVGLSLIEHRHCNLARAFVARPGAIPGTSIRIRDPARPPCCDALCEASR